VPSSATFEIWAGADDTYIYKNSAGYPPSGSVIRAGTLATAPPEKSNFVTATPYEVACAYLEWDTSSFPNDATITEHVYPGGAGTSLYVTSVQLILPRAWHTGFYHRVGVSLGYFPPAVRFAPPRSPKSSSTADPAAGA
jgi:hypothetical protein